MKLESITVENYRQFEKVLRLQVSLQSFQWQYAIQP